MHACIYTYIYVCVTEERGPSWDEASTNAFIDMLCELVARY